MNRRKEEKIGSASSRVSAWGLGVMIVALLCPFNIFSDNRHRPVKPTLEPGRVTTVMPDSIPVGAPLPDGSVVVGDEVTLEGDSLVFFPVDTVKVAAASVQPPTVYTFNPDPTRAVWLSALCPGLGQLYNRRYWKLPIVVGGFMGLGYATSWNNGMLRDYSRAYADLMDNDPNSRSYMDFFPPTVKEEDLNRTWLVNVFKSRKDYYRRNRDLCIVCMVGVYLLAMVDAYVDATMTHFDISPDLSMDVAPALIPDSRSKLPGVGLQWAVNF